MLDLRRLLVFREVAERSSFSAAADALSYTQSAVSQQIAALEKEVGTKLFERQARRIQLTEPGRVLLSHAECILARVADAEEELAAVAGLRAGRLRVVSFPTASAAIMPRAATLFTARFPDVDLTLSEAEPDDGLTMVRGGEADVAIVLARDGVSLPEFDDLESRHVLDDPISIALPGNHRLAERSRVKLSDLAEERWIGTGAGCPDNRITVRACHEAGFEPNFVFHSEDYVAIQGFVAAGLGVSMIPRLALTTLRDDVAVRPLHPKGPCRVVAAVTAVGPYRSPAASAMLDILVEASADVDAQHTALAVAS